MKDEKEFIHKGDSVCAVRGDAGNIAERLRK